MSGWRPLIKGYFGVADRGLVPKEHRSVLQRKHSDNRIEGRVTA
jgi:hypothetical protein